MKPSYEMNSQAIGNYITHEQTLITGNDTQQFLHESERRRDSINEAASAATVDRICRNCGTELASVTQDICSNRRACENRAPFAMPRMRAAENDATWSVGLFEKYSRDPRMQIVLDSDKPDEPSRTKAPNLMHVMRMIAAGNIQEADTATRERAVRFCDELRGI